MTTTNVTMQHRRDTSANWKTNNPVINAGEICFETDTGKMKIGNGSDNYLSLPYKANDDVYKMADKIFGGADLSVKFAGEISKYSDVWAWVKARKDANNFDGIHIGDYIPMTTSAGTVGTDSYTQQTFNMYVMGIDTYYQYGDTAVGHHIDFFGNKHIGKNVTFNPTDNNNGTADQPHSWLASNAYAYLNGVNNYSTNAYNNVAHGGDYSAGGFYDLLPQAVKNVIIEKRMYLPKRYSASGLLTDNTAGGWANMGKLWTLTEMEVYGSPIHSAAITKGTDGLDFGNVGSPVQYPLFAGTAGNRNFKTLNRINWWLASVPSGSSTHACNVNNNGNANTNACTNSWNSLPL